MLPPSVDNESPAAKDASPPLPEADSPASRVREPPNKSPDPTVRAISPPDADVETPLPNLIQLHLVQ